MKKATSIDSLPFELVQTPRGSAYAITCGRCHRTETLGVFNFGARVASEQLPKKAAARGWAVGRKTEDHRCPGCLARAAEEKRRTSHLRVVPKADFSPDTREEELTVQPNEPLKAEPPRQMSREDRRVIFAKLDEVYVDEATGYDRGWSDKRVAEDLGVPRAWVAEVREQNFGPDVSPDALALIQLRAGHAAIAEQLKAVATEQAALGKRLDALKGELAGVEQSIREIERRMR